MCDAPTSSQSRDGPSEGPEDAVMSCVVLPNLLRNLIFSRVYDMSENPPDEGQNLLAIYNLHELSFIAMFRLYLASRGHGNAASDAEKETIQ